MDRNDIIEAVKKGMEHAAYNTRLMDFSSGGKINTEYFATVSIGQALLKSKEFRIGDEKIIFEYNTGKFLTSTVPLIKRMAIGNLFPKSVLRKHANTTRTGRIDIVLLGDNNGISYPKCAIEVKGNSPQKKLLIEDIRRNLEYIKYTGNTGSSKLNLAVNCAFESFYNCNYIPSRFCITTNGRDEKIKEIKRKYERYIEGVKNEIPSDIKYDIDVFSATEILLSPLSPQDEYEQLEDHIHLTLGVLIKFERQPFKES
ncbi:MULTISPECIES: hypothetical protein [Pectobacterium]|uniref:hypothetical protein n=1 Tax=Pectobacterium TaxID=122277 RepID=UPI0004E84127|nr:MULTISPECIES: hypothetical protein [Pectobacterium]AIK13464.1 hypothetical protein GZ59_16350 [Pectobacterium atrosepticum]MBG0751149.1 hypothetical protein [Pectobacterium carotovorum subsp. carotovorum PCCS1]